MHVNPSSKSSNNVGSSMSTRMSLTIVSTVNNVVIGAISSARDNGPIDRLQDIIVFVHVLIYDDVP